MKVILFCGGLGLRMRDYSEDIPKPMVTIGYRPILWHVMKYYAHFGHMDFILCLGYRGDLIKNYFRNYDECLSNDFVLYEGGHKVELLNRDISDWNITFVDTGINSNIGQRLKAVKKYVEGEQVFMANYCDGLTDLPLDQHLTHFVKHNKVASFICVRPNLSYHIVHFSDGGVVTAIEDIASSETRINGGYFIFKQEIFRHLQDGEELLHEPFQRLISANELVAFPYDGFWAPMDTFKDRQNLEVMNAIGKAPWKVWKTTDGE
jgi:glucose-1-phosphate cytidylyltransferase